MRYVLPAEGSQIWEDDCAIAAQEALYTRYATGNHSARALLDEKQRDDPSTYPPPDLLAQLEYGCQSIRLERICVSNYGGK